MTSQRKTAVAVGILFIVATVCPIISMLLISGALDAPDSLQAIFENESLVILGALFELVMVGAIFAIPIVLFPILHERSAGAARGYAAARILEALPLALGVICLLCLVTVSRESVTAAATSGPQFQTLGTLLRATRDWTTLVGGQVIFSLTALILNWTLYRWRLVPRFVSGWGLLAVPLMFAGGLLAMFGVLDTESTASTGLMLPLAVQEMVFAVWLIARGFTPSVAA
jgi:hypothetical protein